LRHVLASMGLEQATARNLTRRLREPGCATYLIPGGIAEMFWNDPDREVVELTRRKGFCKHALRTGAPVLPVYIFGQTQLFYTFSGGLAQLLRRASRMARVSLIPFIGRSWISPFIPLQQPLTCVVGRPLNMNAPPTEHPTTEQIDALHASFCMELRRIFEEYKGGHPGYEAKRLYFDDEVLDDQEIEKVRARRQLEHFHLFPAKL